MKYALAGGNDSFFGFDPTVTAYATNEMLEEQIPNDLSDDSDLGVGLVVSEYKDLVGNVGEDNTSYTLPITPTLRIEDIGDVNAAGSASVAVSGDSTRFESTETLTIKAVDTHNKEVTQTTTVAALGKWNAAFDVSGLKDGTITVTVNGTNDLGAPAKEAGTTFTLTQTKPTVDDGQRRLAQRTQRRVRASPSPSRSTKASPHRRVQRWVQRRSTGHHMQVLKPSGWVW